MDRSTLWISIQDETSEQLREDLGLREDQDPAVWITRLANAAAVSGVVAHLRSTLETISIGAAEPVAAKLAAMALIAPTARSDDTELRRALRYLINQHSRENVSDTPDFVLAELMGDMLVAFEAAVARRERWYGRDVNLPGHVAVTSPVPPAPPAPPVPRENQVS